MEDVLEGFAKVYVVIKRPKILKWPSCRGLKPKGYIRLEPHS